MAIARRASAREIPYRQVPNLNILPEEFRRPGISVLRIILVVVIILEAGLGYFALQSRAQGEQAVATLELQLGQTDGNIRRAREDQAQAKDLQASIGLLEQRLSQLQQDYRQVTRGRTYWPALARMVGLVPQGVTLTSVSQDEDGARVSGMASSYDTVMVYRQALEGSPEVRLVVPELLSASGTAGSVAFVFVIKFGGE